MVQLSDNSGASDLERLAAQLHSEDRFVRADAAWQIVQHGVGARRYLPQLLALAEDPWYQVRIQVPRAIIHMRATQDEAGLVIQRLLHDQDEVVRLYAQEAQSVLQTQSNSTVRSMMESNSGVSIR